MTGTKKKLKSQTSRENLNEKITTRRNSVDLKSPSWKSTNLTNAKLNTKKPVSKPKAAMNDNEIKEIKCEHHCEKYLLSLVFPIENYNISYKVENHFLENLDNIYDLISFSYKDLGRAASSELDIGRVSDNDIWMKTSECCKTVIPLKPKSPSDSGFEVIEIVGLANQLRTSL